MCERRQENTIADQIVSLVRSCLEVLDSPKTKLAPKNAQYYYYITNGASKQVISHNFTSVPFVK